jgi:hypothetical protein
MKVSTYCYDGSWNSPFKKVTDTSKTLIILFGSAKEELIREPLSQVIEFYKDVALLGSSTSGEIYQDTIVSEGLVVSVIEFNTTLVKTLNLKIKKTEDSFKYGREIATLLNGDNLKAIFVLSDGLNINGSQLTDGISSSVEKSVVVTGGLAGDDDRFNKTWTVVNNRAVSGHITAFGLYGDDIEVGYGSKGGWDKLGIQRLVTKSVNNVLYELDSQPALALYKQYLGERQKELPASGLLFPLELKMTQESRDSKVRTILGIDEEQQSITFAGDIPEGSYVTLMKSNPDRLIDGAYDAAQKVHLKEYKDEDILSIAISCVGRRLVLKQRIEEELEATLEVLPKKTKQIGFYSYGEISPLLSGKCDLHNQTMTLTTIWERDASSS